MQRLRLDMELKTLIRTRGASHLMDAYATMSWDGVTLRYDFQVPIRADQMLLWMNGLWSFMKHWDGYVSWLLGISSLWSALLHYYSTLCCVCTYNGETDNTIFFRYFEAEMEFGTDSPRGFERPRGRAWFEIDDLGLEDAWRSIFYLCKARERSRRGRMRLYHASSSLTSGEIEFGVGGLRE